MEVLANHIKSSSEDFKANRAHHDALHDLTKECSLPKFHVVLLMGHPVI